MRALPVENSSAHSIQRLPDSVDGLAIAAADALLELSARRGGLDLAAITPDDAAKALALALQRFSTPAVKGVSFDTLAEGFRGQIAEAARHMARLRAVTSSDRLEVAFQPIVALQSLQLHHHEMLIRFEPETSPAAMIRFAEKVGMIEEIDLAMCRRAIKVLLGLERATHDIAVNISGKSLDSDMFVDGLFALLAPQGSLARQILFEITESTAIADLARVERILVALRKAGHRICLDDFGAGASSFPYLQALSVDFVKIDGGYVSRMRESAKDRAILKAMVTLCRELGIGMIAEMVERVDQAHALLEMGIGYGQGYFFGRPSPMLAPASDFAASAVPQRRVAGRSNLA